MKNFSSWRKEQTGEDRNLQEVTRDQFLDICQNYFGATLRGSMKTFSEHKDETLVEAAEAKIGRAHV